jgi:hypothetical protein
MLKCTYTETDMFLELLEQSLEVWIAQRILLSVRIGQSLFIEQSTASLLLPAHLSDYLLDKWILESTLQQDNLEFIHQSTCDADYFEVTLQGNWVASQPYAEEGVFIVHLSPHHEVLIFELWQKTQDYLPFVSR